MKLLLIQSRTRPEMIATEQEEYARAVGNGVELVPVSSLVESLPWDNPVALLGGFDGAIIGGSGEFDLDGGRGDDDLAKATARAIQERLRPLIEYLVEHDIPTLGVCFGHQLIGNVRGGQVQNDSEQKKIGTHVVSLTHDGKTDRLTASLPEAFNAQYGHKDSITKLPHGANVLVSAPNCAFGGLRYGSKVYTVQFHPELTREDVIRRLNKTPGYLPEGVEPEHITSESPEASSLIPRFCELVV